jgi:hypothetical protein
MQLGGRHRIAAQYLNQRRTQRFALTHPATHAGPVERHAVARRDHRSPITDHRSPITDHRLPITDHRLPIADCRYNGKWSAYFETRISASKLGWTMLRSIGRPGIGGCLMVLQHGQTNLRRIVRTALNAAEIRTSCSDTPSPSTYIC